MEEDRNIITAERRAWGPDDITVFPEGTDVPQVEERPAPTPLAGRWAEDDAPFEVEEG